MEKFSGYVEYTTGFEVESAKGAVRLDLGRVQHLAEVWVNGRSVGARLWAPYEFDRRLPHPGLFDNNRPPNRILA